MEASYRLAWLSLSMPSLGDSTGWHWMVDSETHPMVRRIVGGELGGKSVGIDLACFEDEVLQ
jgi:hypothetical protein